MKPIEYTGPKNGNTGELVDELNRKIENDEPLEDVVRFALTQLYLAVGLHEENLQQLNSRE
jgi:hypothetical protein